MMKQSSVDEGNGLVQLPKASLSNITTPALISKLERFILWCEAHSVRTEGTRILHYTKYLQARLQGGMNKKATDKLFIRTAGLFEDDFDRYMYVLREVHELDWICGGLGDSRAPGIATALRKLVKGADFAALDRNTASRDLQFELRIASYMARAGYAVDLSTLTDVVAVKRNTQFFIECKRIASAKQVFVRFREAADQLRARQPPSKWNRGCHGVVAMDVTKVAFPETGVTYGVTPRHSRAALQARLLEVWYELREKLSENSLPTGFAGVVLQIHLPSLIVSPLTAVTRVSNLFIPTNWKHLRSRLAAERFWAGMAYAGRDDPADFVTVPTRPLESILIPRDTLIAPDLKLFSALRKREVSIDAVPDAHVVLSMQPGGSAGNHGWEDYIGYELKKIWQTLPPELVQKLESPEIIMGEVMCRLVAQRYPNRGDAAWLSYDDERTG